MNALAAIDKNQTLVAKPNAVLAVSGVIAAPFGLTAYLFITGKITAPMVPGVAALLAGLWLVPGLLYLNHLMSTVSVSALNVERKRLIGGVLSLRWVDITEVSIGASKYGQIGDVVVRTAESRIVINPGKTGFEPLLAAVIGLAQRQSTPVVGAADNAIRRFAKHNLMPLASMPEKGAPTGNSNLFFILIIGAGAAFMLLMFVMLLMTR